MTSRTGLVLIGVLGVVAVAAPLLVDPASVDVTRAEGVPLTPPSLNRPLGTDEVGRSVLALLVWGARTSLLVGVLATVATVAIGTLFGIVAGYFTGWVRSVSTAVTNWFLILPSLPFAIVLAAVLGPGPESVAVAIAVTSWPNVALVLRAQTLAVSSRGYLERARTMGAGHWHRIRRHVFPDVLPFVLANATLTMANAILAEATLAFLGLGDPTQVSWGRMLRDAVDSGAITFGAWWYLLPPAVAVAVTAFAFSLCGRAQERR